MAVTNLEDRAWMDDDCSLPDDPDKLRRWARLSPKEWGKLSPRVLRFFSKIGGRFRSEWLFQHRTKSRKSNEIGVSTARIVERKKDKSSQQDLLSFEHESIGPSADIQPARVIEANSENPVEKIQTNQSRLAPSAMGPFVMPQITPQITPQPRSKTWDRDEDPRPHDHPARRAAEAQRRAEAQGKVDAQNLIRGLIGGLHESMAMPRDGPGPGRRR